VHREVSPEIAFGPLQFRVVGNKGLGLANALGDVAAVARGGDGCSAEFDADGADAGGGVVRAVVEPDEVGDPVGVLRGRLVGMERMRWRERRGGLTESPAIITLLSML
jgi:hypothetical protein